MEHGLHFPLLIQVLGELELRHNLFRVLGLEGVQRYGVDAQLNAQGSYCCFLLVLAHALIGLLGYYERIRIFGWLISGLAWESPQPIVYTGFFNLTVFGLVALIIGGCMYSDRIMAFVNTYIK